MVGNIPTPCEEGLAFSIKCHNMIHLKSVDYRGPPQAASVSIEISDDIMRIAEPLSKGLHRLSDAGPHTYVLGRLVVPGTVRDRDADDVIVRQRHRTLPRICAHLDVQACDLKRWHVHRRRPAGPPVQEGAVAHHQDQPQLPELVRRRWRRRNHAPRLIRVYFHGHGAVLRQIHVRSYNHPHVQLPEPEQDIGHTHIDVLAGVLRFYRGRDYALA
ncbi:hypothetical protein CSUB01_11613 [Colletotrichum sublineola]|uniref:Uncharacterized protein n=1 Tax=Colletotrichum sublineola TaxID=1173701 RepID=A0A066XL72_COLSU|nr:hypothetical protein CSUB01_11613 [Colletotrichum sublineola]